MTMGETIPMEMRHHNGNSIDTNYHFNHKWFLNWPYKELTCKRFSQLNITEGERSIEFHLRRTPSQWWVKLKTIWIWLLHQIICTEVKCRGNSECMLIAINLRKIYFQPQDLSTQSSQVCTPDNWSVKLRPKSCDIDRLSKSQHREVIYRWPLTESKYKMIWLSALWKSNNYAWLLLLKK